MAATSIIRSAAKLLVNLRMTWMVAALLPLPILVASWNGPDGEMGCVYLGLACGWLATEIYKYGRLPPNRQDWIAKALAISIAVVVNALLFIFFGITSNVQTQFPFPLMAILSAAPAIGLMPWLVRKTRQQYVAIIVGMILVLAAKLAGSVVARIVYGPNYIDEGYVSADWRTAKLMISLFWIFSSTLSFLVFIADFVACQQKHILSGSPDQTAPSANL